MDSINNNSSPPFNNSLEFGFRSVIILNSFYPTALDINYLTWFDHFIVNSADVGGDISLHPSLPYRSGEIIIKRKLVQDGLFLMRKFGLITLINDETGFKYQSTDESNFLINLISSNYGLELIKRAEWLLREFGDLDYNRIHTLINERLGKWSIEFQKIGTAG